MRSQTWTPLPPPSPQHLSGSSPCTSPKHAALCVRHGLAIQFLHDSIHVAQLVMNSSNNLNGKGFFISWAIRKALYYNTVYIIIKCFIFLILCICILKDKWIPKWMFRKCLGPRGMIRGGRMEGSTGWGTRVYLWRIHVDVWQNQYNIVK